jgi:hypothetical protein
MAQTLAVVEYPITITPYKEDSKYWHVIENTGGDILMLYGIWKYILIIWEKDNEGREDKWMSARFFDIEVFAASRNRELSYILNF